MKISGTFALATILIIVTLSSELSHANCIDSSECCSRNTECCTGCCEEGKCVQVEAGNRCRNPCDLKNPPCSKHEKCILQDVQCIRCPCPPLAICVPRN